MPEADSKPGVELQSKESWGRWRLRKGLEIFVGLMEGRPSVSGLENLDTLNAKYKGKIVIAVPHELDSDVTVAALALVSSPEVRKRRDFNLKIADVSSHHSFKEQFKTGKLTEILVYFGQRLIGEKNFLPVDYKREGEEWRASPFNPKNTEPMLVNLKENQSDILIAAYNPPPKDQPVEKRNSGAGAAYVSEIAGVPVLPVRVERVVIGKKKETRVILGEPIFPDGTDIEGMEKMFDRRAKGEKLTHEDFGLVRKALNAVREKSERIMKAVLPASRPS